LEDLHCARVLAAPIHHSPYAELYARRNKRGLGAASDIPLRYAVGGRLLRGTGRAVAARKQRLRCGGCGGPLLAGGCARGNGDAAATRQWALRRRLGAFARQFRDGILGARITLCWRTVGRRTCDPNIAAAAGIATCVI